MMMITPATQLIMVNAQKKKNHDGDDDNLRDSL